MEITVYLPTLYLTRPDKLCRACLAETCDMFPLFADGLEKKFNYITGLKSFENDGLPNLMCLQCVEQCNQAFTFKQVCENSNAVLRQYLSTDVQAQPLPNISVDHDYLEDVPGQAKTELPVQIRIPENTGSMNLDNYDDNVDKIIEQVINECFSDDDLGGNLESLQEPPRMQKEEEKENAIKGDIMEDPESKVICNEEANKDESPSNTKQSKKGTIVCEQKAADGSSLCPVCGKSFKLAQYLRRHMKLHAGNVPLCEYCGKQMHTTGALAHHLRTHTGEKPYKCDICEKTFSEKNNFKRHLRIHTGVKPFRCNICNKSFTQSYSLKTHLTTHSGVKPFKCNLCPRVFAQRFLLTQHLLVHSGNKPPRKRYKDESPSARKCHICHKTFAQNYSLNTHLLVHKGERPFKCHLCPKAFSYRQILKDHLSVHEGQKPFKCEYCNKTFAYQSNAKRHLVVHTGERRYECHICNKWFSNSTNHKNHLLTHTGEKPYKCNICHKTFTEKATLRKHTVRIHSKDETEVIEQLKS